MPSTILDKSATRRAWCVPVASWHSEDPAFLILSEVETYSDLFRPIERS